MDSYHRIISRTEGPGGSAPQCEFRSVRGTGCSLMLPNALLIFACHHLPTYLPTTHAHRLPLPDRTRPYHLARRARHAARLPLTFLYSLLHLAPTAPVVVRAPTLMPHHLLHCGAHAHLRRTCRYRQWLSDGAERRACGLQRTRSTFRVCFLPPLCPCSPPSPLPAPYRWRHRLTTLLRPPSPFSGHPFCRAADVNSWVQMMNNIRFVDYGGSWPCGWHYAALRTRAPGICRYAHDAAVITSM